jgi:hypothetical protein
MELQFEKLANQILGEGIGEPGAGASASAAHERHKAEQQGYGANRSNYGRGHSIVWGKSHGREGGYGDHDDVGETKQSYYLSRDGGKNFVFGKDKLTGKPKLVSFNSLDKARSLVSKFPGAQIVDGNGNPVE